jgi:hypothetical protein
MSDALGSVKGRGVSAKALRDKPDLATLVRDKTLKEVESGKLKPSLQHGLMAQQMIDKRNERAADRQLAIRIAAMLGGMAVPVSHIIDVSPPELEAGEDDDDFDPTDE